MTKAHFGQVEGQPISLYTLENEAGIKVKISNYGATITSIVLPDGTDIVCGFDTLNGYFSDAYKANAPYFGCTVGRFSSRIKDAQFELNGKKYQLAANNGAHNLHGGVKAFDKCIWQVKEKGANKIEMSRLSPDMEEGFPGNVQVKVTFRLTNKNALSIKYHAVPDQDTPISLTNHSYFNLSGFTETIENHKAKVHTVLHLKPDASGVPNGEVENIENTASDLSQGKLFKEAFAGLPTGFEHYFLFDNPSNALKKVARFEHAKSKRSLDIATTEPGMLFYTGYYTSDDLARENGDKYGKFRGFCCETHRYPNGPNIKNAPKAITRTGEVYTSETVYSFKF